jgi:hypothetical protein
MAVSMTSKKWLAAARYAAVDTFRSTSVHAAGQPGWSVVKHVMTDLPAEGSLCVAAFMHVVGIQHFSISVARKLLAGSGWMAVAYFMHVRRQH